MMQIATRNGVHRKYAAEGLPDGLRSTKPFNVAGEVEALLVTGATGFIGGAVLAEIIDTPLWPKTLIMVRARDVAEGRQRIIASLNRFFPGRDVHDLVHSDRIILAGLEDAAALVDDQRLHGVSHVVHSAAVTSFGKHPRIHAINVEASEEFVRVLAAKANVKRFINVGTAWCVGMGNGPVISEGTMLDSGAHVVPYTRSKVEFERRVRANFPSFPLISARPSIVVGHSQLGTTPSGSIYWVFRAAQLLGSFSCKFDDKLDVVPADWVASALVQLLLKRELWHDVYHLSAGHASYSTIGSLDSAIAQGREVTPHGRLGYRCINSGELPRAVYAQRAVFGDVNPVLLAKALSIYANFAETGAVFDNTRTLLEGVPPPPPFHTYAALCARTSERASIGAQMEDDFK